MDAQELTAWLRTIEADQATIAEMLRSKSDDPSDAFRAINRSLCTILRATRVGIWLMHEPDGTLICCDLFDAVSNSHRNDLRFEHPLLRRFVKRLKAQGGLMQVPPERFPEPLYSENELSRATAPIVLATISTAEPVATFVSISRNGSNTPWDENELVLAKLTANYLPVLLRAQEKNRAENKLKHNLSLLTGTLESTDEGVVVTDLERRIILTNHRFLEMIGRHASEAENVHGTTIRDQLLHLTKDPKRVIAEADLLYSNPALQGTHRVELKDGRVLERYSRPQRIEGKIVGRIFSYRDITPQVRSEQTRARLERELHQAQKLEAIGTLAGGIAHDFNNILSGITCNIELARGDLPPGHPALASLEEITHSARRASSLVRQILTFSQQEHPERTLISIDSVMKEALGFLRATIPKTVAIEVKQEAPLPHLLANATQLHQVFMNLCINAWHAIGKNAGIIRVTAETVSIAQPMTLTSAPLPAGEYLKISVADTGCGMDERTIEHIFEPFFTTKAPETGTGLGLSVVHGIVHDYGGAIDVTSAPAQGARFDLYLPVNDGGTSSAKDRQELKPFGNNKLILLLDNDSNPISTGKEMLENLGFKVAAFNSPENALADFAKDAQSFDGAICSLNPPILAKLEFTAQLRALRPTLPIIVVADEQSAMPGTDLIFSYDVQKVLKNPLTTRSLGDALGQLFC